MIQTVVRVFELCFFTFFCFHSFTVSSISTVLEMTPMFYILCTIFLICGNMGEIHGETTTLRVKTIKISQSDFSLDSSLTIDNIDHEIGCKNELEGLQTMAVNSFKFDNVSRSCEFGFVWFPVNEVDNGIQVAGFSKSFF